MKKISIKDLQPGMVLARTILNDNFIIVLAENTLLTKAHITRLNFLGVKYAYVKDAVDAGIPEQTIVQSMVNRSQAFIADYQEVLTFAEAIFLLAAQKKEVGTKDAKALAFKSITPLAKQSGVIDYLYELKNMDNSTYNHSLRVSILSGVLAKWMYFDDAKIRDIILAGFLHDIGKTQLDQKLLEKNIENLSSAEYEIYIQHTLNGYHLLSNSADLSDNVKHAALQHHEKTDGSGVPFNSSGDEINEYAKIIAITDLYDHMTTEREGFPKHTPFSAIEKIKQEMFTTLDPKYCMPFLLNVQLSFIGSKVLLSNNDKGKIIQYPKDYAALPVVETETHAIIDLNFHPEIKIIEYNPA